MYGRFRPKATGLACQGLRSCTSPHYIFQLVLTSLGILRRMHGEPTCQQKGQRKRAIPHETIQRVRCGRMLQEGLIKERCHSGLPLATLFLFSPSAPRPSCSYMHTIILGFHLLGRRCWDWTCVSAIPIPYMSDFHTIYLLAYKLFWEF